MASDDSETRTRLAVQTVMQSRNGRRFVFELLEQCGVLESSFTPDALQTAFNEGKRNAGLFVMRLLDQHSPQEYFTMMSEAQELEDHDRRNDNHGNYEPGHSNG
nr:hypothetical protein 11 [bacterium]